MHIEGYDGGAGDFPFEVGDVCLNSDEDEFCILLYANYAYVYFCYLFSGHTEPLCSRIEHVIEFYTKIGHVEEAVVETLLDLYVFQAEDWLDRMHRKKAFLKKKKEEREKKGEEP